MGDHSKGEEVRVEVHPIREEVRGEVHPVREEAGQAREGADRAPVEVHQGTGKIQMEILGQTTKEVLVMEMETATKEEMPAAPAHPSRGTAESNDREWKWSQVDWCNDRNGICGGKIFFIFIFKII